jgi:hypothetical protein
MTGDLGFWTVRRAAGASGGNGYGPLVTITQALA